ncbi:hypothetical protein vseg_016466 [Gypsophila vaccaria]
MASKSGCLCSPTKHPGSFRCHFHRNSNSKSRSKPLRNHNAYYTAAKANALRMLLIHQMINASPPSHDHRRRQNFQPKPTRFYLINSQGHHGIPV